MKWVWPLPNNVPWNAPPWRERVVHLSALTRSPVVAVAPGKLMERRGSLVLTLTDGRLLTMDGVDPCLFGKDHWVQAGTLIGHVAHSGVTLKYEEPDMGVPLVEAWKQVTPRFHRDAPPLPLSPSRQRERIIWLKSHPLWTHPTMIQSHDDAGSLVTQNLQVGGLEDCLSLEIVFVDPMTESIHGRGHWSESPRNSSFRVWLEAGGWSNEGDDNWLRTHDPRLDCGAHTLDEALLLLASRVEFFYGEDAHPLVSAPIRCGFIQGDEGTVIKGCKDAGDGFCSTCGFLAE